ncbi:MAG: AAA domain-containing protein [Pseudonocardiales bacterium]
MAEVDDSKALHLTRKLVDYLAEVTDAAARDPVRDILADERGAPDLVLWLDQLPDSVRVNDQSMDDVLLRVRPPSLSPEPRPPAELVRWIDFPEPRGFDGREPELVELGPIDVQPTSERRVPPNSIVRAFTRWVGTWRQWSKAQQRSEKHRELYEKLESAAKTLEQRDDEFEFVLAVGLMCWEAPDGEQIRRHLVTEPILPKLDRETAGVTVSRVNGKRRFEDKEVLGAQEAYRPDRGRITKTAVIDSDASLLDAQTMAGLHDWLALGFGEAFEIVETMGAKDELPMTPALSASPALVLRPRSRVLLAEAYKRIAEVLREPGIQVPVGLAQLVVDTEAAQRHRWLSEQGAVSGDALGSDPLFPLPANDEQMRVIDMLRTETGVVVQGPPGTGKTHTIANLVSALLARGQRVLVTSQKDQALKVLRDKIPAELRQLCVLLTGGSKDATKELERGLDALSEAVASTNVSTLNARADALAVERHQLCSRSVELNDRVRELRDIENVRHEPVVPGFSTQMYKGTLTEIVREVKRNDTAYDWMPAVGRNVHDVPPLSQADMIELHQLLRSDSAARRSRAGQEIPQRELLPPIGELAHLINVERQARDTAHEDTSALTRQLAGAGAEQLEELQQLTTKARSLLHHLGFAEDGMPSMSRDWVVRAVDDRLAGRHAGLWEHLVKLRDEPRRLQQGLQAQGVNHVIDISPISYETLGIARGWLNVGRDLRAYLQAGGKMRKRCPKQAQKNAADLLQAIRVDGRRPETVPQLDTALARLEAEVAALQLVGKWADAGVNVSAGPLAVTLSELDDNRQLLDDVEALVAVHAAVTACLAQSAITVDLSSPVKLIRVLSAVPAALHYIELKRARSQVNELHQTVLTWASRPEACPELTLLLTAIADRDLDAYTQGLEAIEVARTDQADELRRGQLERTLGNVHPALLDLLRITAHEPVWEQRLTVLSDAWAWSKAGQFVERWRNADEERRLSTEFNQTEDRIRGVTEQLAGIKAMGACLDRMTDTHFRALGSYREHMKNVGAGTGKKTREFRNAARAAMEKAKHAVPAWVVPLPNLLENIAPEHNSFDIVIVDEASQVGLEQLFLLWMAPRVVIVGDDKQCSPGANRMGQLEPLFKSLHEHLADFDPDIRMSFTSKSDLYGLLLSRSGKDAVVGLREHFRCMPEIINWSSSQFYGEKGCPGLTPLREHTAEDLEPLRVVEVTGAFTEGRDERRRNPVEAKHIVGQLVKCIEDPNYAGKTFGIVVLQGTGQIKLLEHEINAAIAPQERQDRKIRVGSPLDVRAPVHRPA